MKRLYSILAVALLVVSSVSLVQLSKRIPRALTRTVAHIRGACQFDNSYFKGASSLSSRYVSPSQILWVFQPVEPCCETAHKSLRQIVRWGRMLSETYFVEDLSCAKGGFLLMERSQCGRGMAVESRYPRVVAESGPWRLFAAADARIRDDCSEWDANTMTHEFVITIVFIFLLAWLFFTHGGACVLSFILSISLLTFFLALGCLLDFYWGRALLCGCSFLMALWMAKLFAKRNFSLSLAEWALVIAAICVLALISLSHYLPTPNFAGNVGGKAKFLYLIGGFTAEFWRGIGVSADMNPAYPPAWAMIVLCLNVFLGVPCEWAVQLVGTAFFTLLGLELASLARTKILRFAVLLYMLGPTSVLVSGAFYSEPGMAFCILAGLRLLTMRPECFSGGLFLGFASGFKAEGVLFSLIAYGVWSFTFGRRHLSLWRILFYGVIVVVPATLWGCFTSLVGARLDGFDIVHFGFSRLLIAFFEIVRSFGSSSLGMLCPLFACLCIAESFSFFARTFGAVAVLLFASVAFSCVYAFFPASDMRWMAETNAPRLLWTLGVMLMGYAFILDLTKRNSTNERTLEMRQTDT